MEYDISDVLEYLKIKNEYDERQYNHLTNYEHYNISSMSVKDLKRLDILFSDKNHSVSYIFNEKELFLFIRNRKIDEIIDKIN